nr:unnamed protein product [Digitaria exilis]
MAKKVSLREAKDIDGSVAVSPVLLAAAGGDSGVLEYLLGHGGDPRMADARGSTPLHDAAERDSL